MEAKARTLFDYLTEANPEFLAAEPRPSSVPEVFSFQTGRSSRRRSSTRSTKWPNLKKITKWREFGWETLRGIFNNQLQLALNTQVSDLHDFSYIQPAFRRIHDENALESILIKSNQSIVLEALLKTPRNFLKQKVEMVRGGQAILIYDKSSRDMPDWAGINERQGSNNILPGETKTSWTWQSTDIERTSLPNGDGDEGSMQSLWPLRQLLNYCICSFARYGYIITNKELVVVRVGSGEATGLSEGDTGYEAEVRERVFDNAIVDYLSIPWESTGMSSQLTINLALWILHILAANNGHLQSTPYASLVDETLIHPNIQRTPRRDEFSFDMHKPLSFETQEAAQPEARKDDISDGSDVDSSADLTEADEDPLLLSHASSYLGRELESGPKERLGSLNEVFPRSGTSASIGATITRSNTSAKKRSFGDRIYQGDESGAHDRKSSITKRSRLQSSSMKHRRKK